MNAIRYVAWIFILALMVSAVAGSALADALSSPDVRQGTTSEEPVQATGLLAKSPAPFVENNGQWADDSLRFAMRRAGANVFIYDNTLALQLLKRNDKTVQSATVNARFIGANEVCPVGIAPSKAVFHYYRGPKAQWRSSVSAFQNVVYRDLYDGIDLFIKKNPEGLLKLEFHLSPGSDWRKIVIAYEGMDSLLIDDEGQLVIATPLGTLIDAAPVIYQDIEGKQVSVEGQFRLLDSSTCGFEVTGAWDPAYSLVIDPDLAWSTYHGGTDMDGGKGIAADGVGNIYVTGYTSSFDFPTLEAYDTTYNASHDAFVSKFSPSGELLWSTYLGGSSTDNGYSIAVSGDGNIYVTGVTYSANFPTPGGNDATHNGGQDVFVSKFNPSGELLWSTYLGGTSNEIGFGIAADSTGNAYVTGYTLSANFPTTRGWDLSYNDGGDAFVSKFSSEGALLWSTYLGGSNSDLGDGIAADGFGNVYVSGQTVSSEFPTRGGWDTSHNGSSDAFVSKFSVDGVLLWSTYLGGSDGEGGVYAKCDLAVDGAGNAIVASTTSSYDFPTPGGYDTSFNGGSDIFVSKFSPSGALLWSTYLGGSNTDEGLSIAVENWSGDVFVMGRTNSPDFPTPGGYDTSFNGVFDDVCLARFTASGELVWGTYLGGSQAEPWPQVHNRGIASDGLGNVYVTGMTTSDDFPTQGGYDTIYDGPSEVFITKFSGFPTSVRTPQLLQLGETVEVEVEPFPFYDFQLDLASGQANHLLVRLTPLEGTGSWLLLGRKGELPALGIFDWSSEELTPQGAVELLIPTPGAGSFYFSVHYSAWSFQTGRFQLECLSVDRYLSDVNPREAGNAGTVTVTVDGLGFAEPMSFELRRAGFGPTESQSSSELSPTEWLAIFDLAGVTPGLRSLAAIWSGAQEEVLSDVLEVIQGIGAKLECWLEAPQFVRPYRKYTLRLRYENNGDADIKAPLFIISSNPPAEMGSPCGDSTSIGTIQLLGINPEGPAGTLPPGFSHTIAIPFQINSNQPHLQVTFSVDVKLANDVVIDWQAQEPLVKPVTAPANWDQVWQALTAQLGSTWGDYLGVLADEAERMRRAGRFVPCVRELFLRLYRIALGESDYLIAGRLVSATSGSGLPLVKLVLREDLDEPSVILETQAESPDGHFCFEQVPPGTYELFAEAYFFNPSLKVTITSADIFDLQAAANPYASEEEEEEPVKPPQSSPTLARDSDGRVYLGWCEENSAWVASFDGTDWSTVQESSDTTATEVHLAYAPDLGDISTDPGLFMVYRDGVNNEAHLRYALGLPDVNGDTSWTSSTAVTSDAYGDHGARAVALPGGEALISWLQRDCSIEDDDDLYFQSVTYPAGLTFREPEGLWGDEMDLISFLEAQVSTDTYSVKFRIAKGKKLPEWVPCIGGKYGFEVEAAYSLTTDGCKGLKGEAALAVGIDLSDRLKFQGAGAISAEYITDKKKCKYIFDKGGLSGSVGGEGKIPAPPGWGTGNYWLFKIEWGVKVGGNVVLGFTWKGTGFPAWPNGGSFDIQVAFGPYGEAKSKGEWVEANVQGQGGLTWGIDFSKGPKDLEWTFTVQFEVRAFLLKAGWQRTWKGKVFGGKAGSLDLAAILFSDDVITSESFTLEVDPLVGTGNQYEGLPVLGDISSNVTMDGQPSLARSSTGEILVAWKYDSPTPATEIGSDIRVAAYNGSSFDSPVVLHSAADFNRRPALAFDSNNNPIVVYASASGSGISLASDPYDILDAATDSDIYFCRRVGSVWSAPAPLATLSGGDDVVSLAAGADGKMTAVWENIDTDTGVTSIMASVWNGSWWSTPVVVSSELLCTEPVVSYVGSKPIAVWLQDDDGTTETVNDQRLHYSILNGSWGSSSRVPSLAAEFDVAKISQWMTRDSLLAVYGAPTIYSYFPEPPSECCEDKEEEKKKEPDPPEPPEDITEPGEPEGEDVTEVIVPLDPNEKVGVGIGPQNTITASDTLIYTVYFENVSTATAAAQQVVVTDVLDPNLDFSSFRFLEVGIGSQIFPITTEELSFHERTDWPDWLGRLNIWWADLQGSFNPLLGLVEWRLRLLDPATGELPDDVFAGLLPPNDETGRGEGHVTFSIRPKHDLNEGTLITNSATIFFDTQAPIVTNTWTNIVVEPTPTPTPTPTPSPTPWQIVFDFIAESDDWTSGGAPIVYTVPDFLWEADYLKMISLTNTNTFGYWQSPQDAVPADADYLYRARFNVSTDITAKSLIPQIRLRANSLNLQQYDVLSIESAGDGGASPDAAGTDYDLYFVPPANDTAAMLAFDLLNFNPNDAATAELSLDTVTVDRFALDSLPTPTVVQDYTFELSQDGWTTGGAPIAFSSPQYIYSAGALDLRAITNTNTFGFWGNHPADITIEADKLYRGTFEIRTDLTNPALVPEMRLRYNTGNLQASHTFGISSSGDGANSPGTTNTTYDRLYFLPPANCVGEDLLVSFDILNFNPGDAPTASLILDRAIIETLSPPGLP